MLEKVLTSVGSEKCSETYAVSSESPVTKPPGFADRVSVQEFTKSQLHGV